MYEGNKWDGFRDQMDEDLLTHLNGNAVYNVSHPCFKLVLEKMEEEGSGTEAFDVATQRIIREFFPECEGAYKQTTAIDNLAATLVYADELNKNTSYIHGAKVMLPVNDSITAVVSGFAGQSSETTLQGLLAGAHGFSAVIMIDDHGEAGTSNEFTDVQLPNGGPFGAMRIKNMTRYPGSSPSRDFCLALEEMETPYFAMTNIFRTPTNLLSIMDPHGNVMLPCLFSGSDYCDASCRAEAGGAALFTAPPSPQPTEQWFMQERARGLMDFPLMPEGDLTDTCVVNGDAMIWSAESARRYCSMLEEKLPKPSADDCTQQDATATSYLAYLQSTGEFEDEYKFYQKEQWGERRVFMPYMEVPECQDETEFPQKNGVVVRRMQDRRLNTNITTSLTILSNMSVVCQLFTNEANCAAHEGCEWLGDFNGRCRLDATYMVPSNLPTSAPTLEPTVLPTALPSRRDIHDTIQSTDHCADYGDDALSTGRT